MNCYLIDDLIYDHLFHIQKITSKFKQEALINIIKKIATSETIKLRSSKFQTQNCIEMFRSDSEVSKNDPTIQSSSDRSHDIFKVPRIRKEEEEKKIYV